MGEHTLRGVRAGGRILVLRTSVVIKVAIAMEVNRQLNGKHAAVSHINNRIAMGGYL